MQPLHEAEDYVHRNESETARVTLRYPTIPLDDKVASWLSHSQPIPMASQADDSSVDDNMSSVGESSWDIIDGSSVAASDDEDHSVSRQSTPSSDGHDQNGTHNATENIETSNKRHEGESTRTRSLLDDCVEDRPVGLHGSSSSATPRIAQQHDEDMEATSKDLHQTSHHLNAEPLRFHESKCSPNQVHEHVEVSHLVHCFDGEQPRHISKEFDLHPIPEVLVGTVRQKMSTHSLHPSGPYKLFYVGPSFTRDPIVQKIGAALASPTNSRSSPTNVGENRFTIAPIAGFGDESGMEVVLLNSLGLDIIVEECTSASYVKEGACSDSISLEINESKKISSVWNRTRNAFAVSQDYKLPDVAIIFLPENEPISAKHTRLLARSFMIRHEVPVIMISANTDWKKPSQPLILDHRTPHLCLESRSTKGQSQRILRRLPIDLSTFLDIDAGQLNRNLACIAHMATEANSNTMDAAQKHRPWTGQGLPELKIMKTLKVWTNFISMQITRDTRSIAGLGAILLTILVVFGIKSGIYSSRSLTISPTPSIEAVPLTLPSSSSSMVSGLPTSIPLAKETLLLPGSSSLSASTRTKNVAPLRTSTDLASFLLDSTLTPNISDRFQLHVVGDCHVVLRPPRWFTMLRRAPALSFSVERHDKAISYEFSTLFDGVYALKLPREDAHGSLNVSVSTSKKPRINETFQVDFGTPWLKIAGWKNAAQLVTEQVREEFQSAQSGLSTAYEHTSSGIQSFMRDAVKKADGVLKEVEKISLISLNQTAKTTEIMVTHSKELSRAVSKHLNRRGCQASYQITARRRALRHDVKEYTRRMSAILAQQAQVLTEAATGLNMAALAQEVQDYREKHLVETQKKALRMWWRVRGLPHQKKSRASRGQNPKVRGRRSKRAANR